MPKDTHDALLNELLDLGRSRRKELLAGGRVLAVWRDWVAAGRDPYDPAVLEEFEELHGVDPRTLPSWDGRL